MAEPEQTLTTRADDLKGRTDSHKLSPDIHKYVVAHVCAHAYTEINTSSERKNTLHRRCMMCPFPSLTSFWKSLKTCHIHQLETINT